MIGEIVPLDLLERCARQEVGVEGMDPVLTPELHPEPGSPDRGMVSAEKLPLRVGRPRTEPAMGGACAGVQDSDIDKVGEDHRVMQAKQRSPTIR